MKKEQIFINAFPKQCEKNIRSLFQKVDLMAEYETSEFFSINFQNEPLQIPFRLYLQEVAENKVKFSK